MWIHVSDADIPVGDRVRSPKDRDVSPRYADADRAEGMGQYRPDSVSIFDPGTTPVEHFRGNFAWFNDSSYAYEVEPVGPMEDDPERSALDCFRLCREAVVLRCVCEPT